MRKTKITPRHFRGLTTVEDVKQRCIVDDFTGCWHWKGGARSDPKGRRIPQLWVFDTLRKEFRCMSGPLAILELEGTRTPEMQRGWRVCLCSDCLNPAHILGGTVKEWGNWLRNHGYWKGQPARIAAGRKNARARSDVTPEIIELAKAAPTGRAAAAALGITESHASKIRLGRIWADGTAPGASVFTLGAR